jgi:sensor histidine kinase YesM
VENALSHGMKAKEDGGRILLKIWQEENILTISLMDNGQGMNLEEKAALHQKILNSEKTGRSIGLGNIYRRMAVLYPEGQLNVYSMEGRGTIIQLKIPQKEGIHHEI